MDDFGEFAHHGGALDTARKLFPLAPEPWIDLSTGINPVSYPLPREVNGDAWRRLPEASALADLERVAARRYRVPPGLGIVAAAGTQAVIQHLPALFAGHDVRLLGRTYEEYKRVYREAKVRRAPTTEALAGADVAIVVNPNNPDGRLVEPTALLALAGRVGTLIVDEAFVDALPDARSVVGRLPPSRIVVLRSFGKTYGLAGLRLGFAIAAVDRTEALRRMLGPWAVSGPAIGAGTIALADDAWLESTRVRLVSDCDRLRFLLGLIGATVIGDAPLFRLAAHEAAPELFTSLAKRGILTRPFAKKPTWLRFGLPASDQEWHRLEAALRLFECENRR